MAAALTARSLWGERRFLLQHKRNAFHNFCCWLHVFYCSAAIPTVTLFLFLWEAQGIRLETGPGCTWEEGEGRALGLEEGRLRWGGLPGPVQRPSRSPCRCRQCSSTLVPGAYRAGPEEGTFVCAEHCARLGPAGRGAKPRSPPQPKRQQEEGEEAAEEAKDVEGGGPGTRAAAGAEARPQTPTKPQDLASPQAGRPMPAPRKTLESTAPTPSVPPTPRPRSSLQPENSVEQGGSSLVNGERGPMGTVLAGSVWCFNGHVPWAC